MGDICGDVIARRVGEHSQREACLDGGAITQVNAAERDLVVCGGNAYTRLALNLARNEHELGGRVVAQIVLNVSTIAGRCAGDRDLVGHEVSSLNARGFVATAVAVGRGCPSVD